MSCCGYAMPINHCVTIDPLFVRSFSALFCQHRSRALPAGTPSPTPSSDHTRSRVDTAASFYKHRRSQDFVWGALLLTKKADDLFSHHHHQRISSRRKSYKKLQGR